MSVSEGRRRGRRHLVVTLSLACGLPLALAAGASAYYFPLTTERFDAAIGSAVFTQHCSGCHTVVVGSAAKLGPNLARIGVEAATRKPGLSAAAYILESILAPNAYRAPGATGEMSRHIGARIGDRALLHLVAFLASRGTRADFHDIAGLDLPRHRGASEPQHAVDLAAVERGYHLFHAVYDCDACHSIQLLPGGDLPAPSLAHAGQLSSDYLRESILNPSAIITPGYASVDVLTTNQQRVHGRLLEKSDSEVTVMIRTSEGHFKALRVRKEHLQRGPDRQAEIKFSPVSSMPSLVLPQDDLEALIQFLKSLG